MKTVIAIALILFLVVVVGSVWSLGIERTKDGDPPESF